MNFKRVIREMQDEELRLLVLRDADAKRRLGETETVLILGTVLGLLIACRGGLERPSRQFAHAALQRTRCGTAKKSTGGCSTESRTTPS